MKLIDTHSHMYLKDFDEDREACMQRALEKGVAITALPNIDRGTIASLKKMLHDFPGQCIGMMGLHPCSVNETFEEELNAIRKELEGGKYFAIGEIGIDLYWEKKFIKEQEEAFQIQCEWARELDLPVVIHARDSLENIFEVLDRVHDEKLRGVFHCFTGTEAEAKKALSYEGFYLGIGGIVTFKNSGLDKVLSAIGPDRLVLETDAPYLTPAPYRGKRNETSYTYYVAGKLAEIFDMSEAEIAELTTSNATKLFGIHEQ